MASLESLAGSLFGFDQRLGDSMKVVVAVVLLLVTAFCVYGFIAAGEPGEINTYFRVGYPIAGLVSLAGAVALLVGGRRTQ
jgi:hypothetical protein